MESFSTLLDKVRIKRNIIIKYEILSCPKEAVHSLNKSFSYFRGLVVVGCRFESNCPLVGPGTIGGVSSEAVFLKDPSPYLSEFRRKPQKHMENSHKKLCWIMKNEINLLENTKEQLLLQFEIIKLNPCRRFFR